MLPKRIPRPSKPDKRYRSPAHRTFVRSHACSACGSMIAIEVAHVRTGTDGGMGMKPGDYWTISLCKSCHGWQHSNSEQALEAKHGFDMKTTAREFVKASPKRRELEQARDGL